MGKLTSKFVLTAPVGKHGDGAGLQLVVSPSGARKWVYRFMMQGRAREMGLGDFPTVGLTDAREKALKARKLARSGVDPIEDRKKDRNVPTFGTFADHVANELSAGFRSAKHATQWTTTLSTYAAPLRDKPVAEIDTADVLTVLRPIWLEKPETANRVRGRIERVLNAAKARGFRSAENPAAWRGHLDQLLPKQPRLGRHHAAMPYADVPGFVTQLRERRAAAALALEFVILTACRVGEVLEATWSEIDLGARTWTIPGARMKAGKEHRVPLSERAVEIIEWLSEAKRGEHLFPGTISGKPLSPMVFQQLLRRMPVESVTTHGFRSSFRDWAGDMTDFPREVAEAALAHSVGDRVEAAYRRGSALEKRRALMDAWARFCSGNGERKVVHLVGRRKA